MSLAALLFGLAAALAAVPAPAAGPADSPAEVARRAIEVRQIANPHGPAQFDIASDGETFAYVVSASRTDGAAYTAAIFLGRLDRPGKDRLIVSLPDSPSPFAQPSPRFSPDGHRLAFLADGGVDEIDRTSLKRLSLTKGRLPEGSEVVDFAWSPDGTRLALRLAMPSPPPGEGGMVADVGWPLSGDGPGTRLAILGKEGPARIVTGPELDVAGMSWSPEGHYLALAASPVEATDRFYAQDIYLADLETGRTAPVARLDGVDSDPAWSPDGRWLAFATQAGQGNRDWLQKLGLIDVATGEVSFPAAGEFEAGLGSPHDLVWRDSKHLLFTAAHRLRSPILELELGSPRLKRLSPLGLEYFSGIAAAPAAKEILFGCEAVDRPRELCLSRLAGFSERQVTSLNPGLRLPREKISIVSWRSADDRWDLDGILVLPEGATGPLPTVALIEGGPSMVRVQYELEQQHPVHALVAAGYAVFLPNTRGRSGYSTAFRRSIAHDRDYVEGGFGDVMSGIDRLVAKGIADPKRLAIAGFSYGGVLTAYAMTRTRRFAAASIMDAPVDLAREMALGAANPVTRAQWRDQVGYGDAYDPKERALMDAQSPLAGVASVRTPALLEYGLKQFGGFDETEGAQLFQALRRFSVPSLLVRYPRTGHGIYEPRLRIESARRNLDWFAKWLSPETEGQGLPAR